MKLNFGFGKNVDNGINLHVTPHKVAVKLTISIIFNIHFTRAGHCYLPFRKLGNFQLRTSPLKDRLTGKFHLKEKIK